MTPYPEHMLQQPTLDDLAQECHDISKAHGFWDHAIVEHDAAEMRAIVNPSINGEKIALMHSELSEALEACRDGDRDQEEEELADTIIRILDYAHARGFSMDKTVRAKITKNRDRPHLHGRRW